MARMRAAMPNTLSAKGFVSDMAASPDRGRPTSGPLGTRGENPTKPFGEYGLVDLSCQRKRSRNEAENIEEFRPLWRAWRAPCQKPRIKLRRTVRGKVG